MTEAGDHGVQRKCCDVLKTSKQDLALVHRHHRRVRAHSSKTTHQQVPHDMFAQCVLCAKPIQAKAEGGRETERRKLKDGVL